MGPYYRLLKEELVQPVPAPPEPFDVELAGCDEVGGRTLRHAQAEKCCDSPLKTPLTRLRLLVSPTHVMSSPCVGL
jgi:hypothetical protein